MLFNSYPFIFFFLPVALAVFYFFGGLGHRRAALVALTLASLFFYGWWNPKYLLLIVGSMVFNFAAGWYLGERSGKAGSKLVLAAAVGVNLLVIGYYKYAVFVVGSLGSVLGTGWSLGQIILPLGISFFTFQQIAYVVDAYHGKTKEHDFVDYSLFVTFFPQLIAGPIVHHQQVLPQFKAEGVFRFQAGNVAVGVTYFVMGLFKKVVLADGVARFASPVFAAAAEGPVGFWSSWQGVLAYSLQIYFDFSGYSDMAVGLGRMFNIMLPQNFNSPYQAVSMIDFWRRWHMTLSAFLRDYLYIPLGGNRLGELRRYVNVFVTMLLGGIWHGAGWQFILWGAIHGVGIVINHLWADVSRKRGLRWPNGLTGRVVAQGLTLLTVILAWVFFRAENVSAAWRIFEGMFSWKQALSFGDAGVMSLARPGMWLVTLTALVLFCPNTSQIMEPEEKDSQVSRWFYWRPGVAWALATGVAFVVVLLHFSKVSEFLYFQF